MESENVLLDPDLVSEFSPPPPVGGLGFRGLSRRPGLRLGLPLPVGGVEIGDRFYRNLLVRNYWRMLTGLLYNSDVTCKDESGTDRSIRMGSGAHQGGWNATPYFGTNNQAAAWDQYWLLARDTGSEGSLGSISKNILTNEIEISVPRTAGTNNVKEIGLAQTLYDTASAGRNILYGRVVPATPPTLGQIVNYKLKVQKPWTDLFAKYLFGHLSSAYQSATNFNGTGLTMRAYGADTQWGAMRLYAGVGTGAHAWTDYTLTTPQRMTETYNFTHETNYVLHAIAGFLRPTSNITIGEVGVVGCIYDTSAVQHEVLLARHVLGTPVSVSAYELFSVLVQIYASA